MQTPVQSKAELLERIKLSEREIRSFGVTRLGIFGSFARDRVYEKSDIDLLIDFLPEYKTLKNFSAFSCFLKNLFGRKTEIITPQSLNKFTGKHILQEVEYVAFAA